MSYATVAELAALLRVDAEAKEDALQRALDSATTEIDDELGLDEPYEDEEIPALAAEVCIERAVEHWQQSQSPFGLIGIGSEAGPVHTANDSWNRHANKLRPLKETWGLA